MHSLHKARCVAKRLIVAIDAMYQHRTKLVVEAAVPANELFDASRGSEAAEAAKVSDGVILGSAIVKLIETNSNPVERDRKLGEFLTSIKKAINS